jgi:hypothetical protein
MCRIKPEARGFPEYKDPLQILFPVIYLAGITEKMGCIIMNVVTVVKSEGDNRKQEDTTYKHILKTKPNPKPNLDSSGYQKGVSLDF